MKKWNDADLAKSVKNSKSIRQVLAKLSLVEAGGNYSQIKQRIIDLGLNIDHFHGKGWRTGLHIPTTKPKPLSMLLVENSSYQSHKLKIRLFAENIKKQSCELCGWAKKSLDGRIPVELDHVNGDHRDNRIGNLRILCPNCHSLQPTHRGKNIGKKSGNGSVA